MKSSKNTPEPTLPKLVSLNRYAKACGVSVQSIRQRTQRKNNPLPIVQKTDPDTQETKSYIDTEENPPIKMDKGRKPIAASAQ